jgi:hypothetical protein
MELGIVVHAFKPSTREAEAENTNERQCTTKTQLTPTMHLIKASHPKMKVSLP